MAEYFLYPIPYPLSPTVAEDLIAVGRPDFMWAAPIRPCALQDVVKLTSLCPVGFEASSTMSSRSALLHTEMTCRPRPVAVPAYQVRRLVEHGAIPLQ